MCGQNKEDGVFVVLRERLPQAESDNRWALRRCGRVGHVLAFVDSPGFDNFWVNTPVTLCRCLRCGMWVNPETVPQSEVYGSAEKPVGWENVPLVARGSHGRKMGLLKLVAAERAVRALGLLIGAVAVFAAASARETVITKLDALITAAQPLALQIGWHIEHSHTIELLQHAVGSSVTAYIIVGVFLTAYAVIQLVEAYGLWGGWRWAEYLAVIATSVFVPLEVWEIVTHVSYLKIVMLIVNLAIVAYLVFKGRLFGVRGGHAAWLEDVRASTFAGKILAEHNIPASVQTNTKVV